MRSWPVDGRSRADKCTDATGGNAWGKVTVTVVVKVSVIAKVNVNITVTIKVRESWSVNGPFYVQKCIDGTGGTTQD